jgi:exopolysaccharide biosynthesis polyprenyl glycosylphosphotransferase
MGTLQIMTESTTQEAAAATTQQAVAAEVPPGPAYATPDWSISYASRIVVIDCIAIFLSLAAAYGARFGDNAAAELVHGFSYGFLLIFAGPVWLASLVAHRCYDTRIYGSGPAEFRRLVVGTARLFAAAAVVCFAFKLPLSRVFAAVTFGVGLCLLLTGRWLSRKWLYRQRLSGGWCQRVLAIGDAAHVDDLARLVSREPSAGFVIVGACFPGGVSGETTEGGVPSFGSMTGVAAVARAARCDAIAVTASPSITAATLRRLAWDLEGTGVGLIVAPALTDVAGPRISIHPVAGLPLLYVDEPELGGLHRTVKRTMDIAITSLTLLLLSPLFLVLAVLVKSTSRGPIIFRQTRVGRESQEFRAYKFRSMTDAAEQELSSLESLNEAGGLLFKMRADPRVTRFGRFLRRYSLDELPQLWNVLKGDMSLVGPRPPLPSEVKQYAEDVRRRLLVKPGVTGLWQVSGRSDLSWEDTVRLDLYYVENWSPVLDLVILARTVVAVVRGAGAY